MRVGLFVPCYIDQFYPHVAIATLQLLERLGCSVDYPADQTCCGQPMSNAGHATAAIGTMHHFVRCFAEYDYIVAPSGSCVAHVRENYDVLDQTESVRRVRERIFELCTFLMTILHVTDVGAVFPHRVGLHAACHGLRMLGTGRPSEILAPRFDHVRELLQRVDGIDLVELDRLDECCGFGGTFSVSEEAVSVKMGRDRIRDHMNHGADVITSTDMSCLMHLEGLIRRQNLGIRVMHVAEILGSAERTEIRA